MKQKPDQDDSFYWFSCFQPFSGQQAAKGTIPLTPVITGPARIMEGIPAGSVSQFTTDPTMSAALVTGPAAPITFGNPGIGVGGMVRKFGSTAITSCEDIRPRRLASGHIPSEQNIGRATI
jgi:hypothetical protein